MSSIGQAGLGFVMVVLSIAMYMKNRLPTVRSVMIFVGILLMGFTGAVFHGIARLVQLVFGLTSTAALWAFGVGGVAVAAALVAWMVYHLFDGWHPKGTAKKSHFWVAGILALLIVASATPFAALNGLPGTLQQGIRTTQG